MGIVKTDFIHIECNGPAATPFKPHCSAEAEGGWDQGEVEKTALLEGWSTSGRSWYCSKHSRPAEDKAAAEDKPATTSRKARSAAASSVPQEGS